MKIGNIVIDKGCDPERLGVVVDVRKQGFTIAHLKDFLAFENEHRFHSFGYSSDEYVIIGVLNDNKIVDKLVREFKERWDELQNRKSKA